MGTFSLISLGSNLGDRKAHLDNAVAALADAPGIELRAVSSYHETEPVGGPAGQGPFLNAAAALETSLDPHVTLSRLQRIENQAGRVREAHWGERTLDLDLLLFGDQVIGRQESVTSGYPCKHLCVPHPFLGFRGFVLAPAAEVAPEAIDPVTRLSIAELLANVDRRPSYLALCFGTNSSSRRQRIFRKVVEGLSANGLSQGECPSAGWRAEPGSTIDEVRTRIAQRAEDLRADRWTAELWGDRWIVTDFWLHAHRYCDAAEELRPLLEGLIQPTFVVLPRTPKGLLRSISERVNRSPGGGSRVPIFVPNAVDDEGIVGEILTICAASRAGRDCPGRRRIFKIR